jgi:tetratricopeptide (TPR) repeat protein
VKSVLAELDGLAKDAPPSWRFEAHVRVGFARGALGEHEAAALTFRAALGLPRDAGEPADREALRAALLLAEYRAGRFAVALDVALDAIESRIGRATPRSQPGIDGLARIAADCVERSSLALERLDVRRPNAAAAVMTRLALRRAYRGDRAGAIASARAAIARAPTAGVVRDAYALLATLADEQGDSARAAELRARVEKAPRYDGSPRAVLGGRTLEDRERDALGLRGKPKSLEAAARHAVDSLVRFCLEPSFWRMSSVPLRTDREKKQLTVRATITEPGAVTAVVEVEGEAPAQILGCLREHGPRVLAAAPSSLHASIDVTDVQTPEWIARSGIHLIATPGDFGGP